MTSTVTAPTLLDQDYDKVAAEIVRRGLLNLTNEMALALINTSGSPVVFEVKDFCTCLLDVEGEHLSYSAYALLHAGASRVGTKATIAQIRADGQEIRPGDAWILNDPFDAGSAHQGDVAVVTPVFYGERHLGWCFTSMHVSDIGGTGVSGYAPSARVVYDEGLLLPPTRMVTGGRIDPEWERFLRVNVRMPNLVMSDIRSMMAANNVGQEKLVKVVEQYGLERFLQYCEINADLTERELRRRIRGMRDGVYESTNWIELDGEGRSEQLLELRTRLVVDDGDLYFSFSGVPQALAFVNANEGQVIGNVMAVILTVLGYGDLPFNAGMWRPLHFDMGDPGSIVNAVPPAAMSNGHTEAGFRVAKNCKDVLVQALSLSDDPQLRSRVAGTPHDGFPIAGLTGLNQFGEPTIVFLLDNAVGAGGGAQTTGDGQDVYFLSSGTGAGLAQIETHESRQPVLFLWRRLQRNSGGPGQNRGGQSLEEAFLLHSSDGVSGSATNSCSWIPSLGAGGGLPGSTGDYWPIYEANATTLLEAGRAPVDTVLEGQPQRVPLKTGQLGLGRGDVLRLLSGGGGGLGDPLLRDPDRVAADLRDDYITAANALAAYGVVVTEDGEVDHEATRQARADRRRQRLGKEPEREQGRPAAIGIAVETDGSATAESWRCAYCHTGLGPVTANWRDAAVATTRPAADYFASLEMTVRSRSEDPAIMVAERCCPGCAGLLTVEVFPADFAGFPSPRISGEPVEPLAAPV
ncbi:hydantoinase B/oxoprolinase family protein [Mycolicibacterium thermoresistibile]